MTKKKIVLEECTSDCWQYNDGCLLATSDAIPLNCPLPDDRESELEAENARLKGVVKAQAETIRLMTKKQAVLAERARERRKQLEELREAVAHDVMAGFELSTKLQQLAGVKP